MRTKTQKNMRRLVTGVSLVCLLLVGLAVAPGAAADTTVGGGCSRAGTAGGSCHGHGVLEGTRGGAFCVPDSDAELGVVCTVQH